MIILSLSLFLAFVSVTILSATVVPIMVSRSSQMSQEKAKSAVSRIDRYLNEAEIKKLYRFTLLGPFAGGILGAVVFPEGTKLPGVIAGVVVGYLLPRMYISYRLADRKKKFNDQLMDAIMIISSSFRGGLSLIQAFEAVVDEMSEPVKGEFGVVLGENKMGVSLEESLNRFYQRMPSPALQQMVTAILLARETGGNLSVIFTRIINSTRERKKIENNLKTLTVQGKIQAVVMTGLPVFFFFTVSASNPHFFDHMMHSPTGQKMLMTCAVLWVLGALSIWKISTIKEV
ncbi:MAG: type II secretion system F family protein [Candidatus Omnitrophica bacterium]|nr:type II secretion system F family protein [Candidatus Omnitrophota bacterium]